MITWINVLAAVGLGCLSAASFLLAGMAFEDQTDRVALVMGLMGVLFMVLLAHTVYAM